MNNMVNDVLSERKELNELLNTMSTQLSVFNKSVITPSYEDGAVSAKNKHLIGLAVSVHADCRDGVVFHISELLRLGVSENEFYECIQLCIVDGGSLKYPCARHALKSYLIAVSNQ